jgi:hypothetical protein
MFSPGSLPPGVLNQLRWRVWGDGDGMQDQLPHSDFGIAVVQRGDFDPFCTGKPS